MALTALMTVEALPSFVTDPPADEQYYYEFGEAEGTDKARAWAIAEQRAQESLQHQLETRLAAMQLDFEINTKKRAESFFTQVRHIISDISVRSEKVKSVAEGDKYYVLVRAKGIEEEVLEQIIDYAQKTKDPDFEQAAKKSMTHAFDKAQAVIIKAEAKQKDKAQAALIKAEAKQKWDKLLSTVFSGAEYAKRNTVGEAAFAVEWSGDKTGMGLELLDFHWSFLPFTSVGMGLYPFEVGGYNSLGFETMTFGASLYAGLVYPFIKNDDDFNLRLYGDFLFTIQTGGTGAGFATGLLFTWEGFGFDIRYRGVVYDGHYVNSLGIGVVFMFNDM
jgi:hypothetical protein